MNLVIDYSIKYKVLTHNNVILEKALESKKIEDRMIGILTKEISEFILQIVNKKDES